MAWRGLAWQVLKKIKGNQSKAAPFLEPLDPIALGLYDYFEVVKRPMDLGTVERTLKGGEYASARDFLADLRRIFDNAMLYNPGSDK
ncbi:Bromodomain-containing protein, partial [Baffinella frigidus]